MRIIALKTVEGRPMHPALHRAGSIAGQVFCGACLAFALLWLSFGEG